MVRPRTRCRLLFLVPHDYCMILLGAKLSQALCEPVVLLDAEPAPGTISWIEQLEPKELVILGVELPRSLRQPLRTLRIPAHSILGQTPQQISLKAFRTFGAKSGLRPLLTWDQDPLDWPETFPLFFSGDWDALGPLKESKRLLVAQTPFGPLRAATGLGTPLALTEYRYHSSLTSHPFALDGLWSGRLATHSGPIPFERQVRYRCALPLPPWDRPAGGQSMSRSGSQNDLCWSLSEFADRDGDGQIDHCHAVQYLDLDGDGSVDRRIVRETTPLHAQESERQERCVQEVWDPQLRRWKSSSVLTEFSPSVMQWRRRITEEDLDGDGHMESRQVTDLQKIGPLTVGEIDLFSPRTNLARTAAGKSPTR